MGSNSAAKGETGTIRSMFRRGVLILALLTAALARAQERIQDVIYLKSEGAAFTMDVFKPKSPNGAAVIYLVSGGWFSSHSQFNLPFAQALNNEGFTVFEVVHGSQPRYKIPEIARQITRAVRFVHANAATYGVDPNRLGITGASAGGHLSLLTAGRGDQGNKSAKDPVERQPSTVAAVVAVMPPTDFMNYNGATPQQLFSNPMFAPFKPAFGAPANASPDELNAIAKELSPITTVSAKFPPTLFIHGDKDTLVPLQQSQVMKEALSKAGVDTELLVVAGGGHDAKTVIGGMPKLIAWFKAKLVKQLLRTYR